MSQPAWEPLDPSVQRGPVSPGVPAPVPQYAYPPPSHPVARQPYPPAYVSRPYREPGVGLPRPVAVQPIPGTPFGVAIVEVKPTTSGPATASLVVGIASVLVSLLAGCFAQVGADRGWGAAVAGAFAALAGLASLAAIWLHRTGVRRIGQVAGWGPAQGRGMAIAGLACGIVGLAITVLVMVVAITR